MIGHWPGKDSPRFGGACCLLSAGREGFKSSRGEIFVELGCNDTYLKRLYSGTGERLAVGEEKGGVFV